MFTIFTNGSIIPPGFKFTELHALTLAARSYALLLEYNVLHSGCLVLVYNVYLVQEDVVEYKYSVQWVTVYNIEFAHYCYNLRLYNTLGLKQAPAANFCSDINYATLL